jgi:transcription initiation factor TFIIIB Brf1 subunit/transcription initiation factor TFIIB
MIECPHCGAKNKEGEAICYRCGGLLDDIHPDTRIFAQQDDSPVIPKRRWGTARFDNETFVLLHVRGYESPLRVRFNQEELVLGRTHGDSEVDIDFSNFGGLDAGVSRRHALLRRQNDTIVLIDLSSANSTYLNGQRIVPNEPRILRDGDEMRLGRLVCRVTFEDEPIQPN